MGVVLVGQLLLLSACLLWKEYMYSDIHGPSYTASEICFHRLKTLGWPRYGLKPPNPRATATFLCVGGNMSEQEHHGVAQRVYAASLVGKWPWAPATSLQTSLLFLQWKIKGWKPCEQLKEFHPAKVYVHSPHSELLTLTHVLVLYCRIHFMNYLKAGWRVSLKACLDFTTISCSDFH